MGTTRKPSSSWLTKHRPLPTNESAASRTEIATGDSPWHQSSSATVRGALMDPAHTESVVGDDLEPIVVLDDDQEQGSASQSSIPPFLLTRLATYAQGRLQAGAGNVLLASLGADHPGLLATYRMGYLPATYTDAVSKADRALLKGQRLGNRLILPATDAAGQVVDLLAIGVTKGGEPTLTRTSPQPLGLLGASLITVHDELIITDAVSTLIDCFRQGFPNTLLLRGAADASLNASRLVQAGVRRVILRTRHDAGAIGQALAAAGIDVSGRTVVAVPSVEPETPQVGVIGAHPTTPDGMRIVSEDRSAEVVLVEAGPIRYAVERHHPGDDPRRLVVIRVQGQTAQDRLDLTSEPARRRFAGNAGQRLGVAADVIAAHLADLEPLLAGAARTEQQRHLATISADDRSEAEAWLSSPDLLSRICADLTTLGWIGEDRAKALLYLTGISRLLPQPLWTVYRSAAAAAPWQGTALIAALTPPEERVVFHRLTDAAIRQQGAEMLRHRLVVVDQAESMRPEASLALRILKERGGIGWATLATDAVGEVRGPVAVLAAAAADVDVRCRDCFVTVPADERPEQTARVLVEQRRQHGTSPTSATVQSSIVARHHAIQRLLVRMPVIVPDADRIIFPAAQVRHRGEQAWFLTLIEAIALVYQQQREQRDGAIIATEADIRLAMTLADGVLAMSANGLSRTGRDLLEVLTQHRLATFTMADLAGLLPDWTRWTFRAALQDLIDFGYLEATAPKRGRGNLRRFTLVTRATTDAVGGITLRSSATPTLTTENGEMAENGGTWSPFLSREVVNG